MNLQGKAQLSQCTREMGGETKLPRLYTKSLSCLSAHHFSDWDNSTKSVQHPCGGTGCEVSELTSHIKKYKGSAGKWDLLDLHSNKRCVGRIRPKVCSRAMCKLALCLSMVLLPSLFYCQPLTQWALKQLNQRFNLPQNYTWRTDWMENVINITSVTDEKPLIWMSTV